MKVFILLKKSKKKNSLKRFGLIRWSPSSVEKKDWRWWSTF